MVAGAAAVAVVALVAAAIWWSQRGSADADTADGPAWNAIAEVNPSSGAIRIVDTNGEETATVPASGRVTDVFADGGRLALVGEGQLAFAEAGGGDPNVVVVDFNLDVARLPSDPAFVLAGAPSAGGNLVLVDAARGTTFDVGALASMRNPLIFPDSIRSDPDGDAWAVGDSRDFQTVVIRADRDDAAFYPGAPLAIGGDLVATSQNVGSSAEIGLFDAAGERVASFTSARPAGGVISDGRLVFVTVDGTVLAASEGDDEAEELGALTLPAADAVHTVSAVRDGTRLVVAGDRFQAAIDLDGDVLFQTTFADDIVAPLASARWRCMPVGGSATAHSIVDLADGTVLADLDGRNINAVSADGCAAQVARGSTRVLVNRDGRTVLPTAVRSAALSPDGAAAVIVAADGSATLVEIGAPDAEAQSLGSMSGLLAFVER